MPANDLKEFIAWLKANPGNATQGSAGVGSMGHIGGVYFQNITGPASSTCHIAAPLLPCRIWCAGQIDMMIDAPVVILPQLRAGTIKAFAVLARSAPGSGTRRPDGRRGRVAGLPCLELVRLVGSQRHAARRSSASSMLRR